MTPISVCIIAKNEEKRIERLLSSLAPYQFEIVIADTGSTDRTKEIATKYTDCIYDFVWQDDFSAARNFSLSKASNDWILMMDCDEWIQSLDLEELNYFRKHLPHAVGSVVRENITGTPKQSYLSIDQTERFFNRKRFKYSGIIHEQLTPKFEKTFEAFLLKTTIGHDGYLMTNEERLAKSQRNISLLQKQLAEEPDNPYVLYQLGKGYEMINDAATACEYFQKAIRPDLDPTLAYVQALMVSYGESLLELGQFERALTLESLYDKFAVSADFVYLMGLIYVKNKQYEKALDQFEKALTFEIARKDGANSYLSYYEIGCILSLISEWGMARSYFDKCGDYPPALHAIKILNENHL